MTEEETKEFIKKTEKVTQKRAGALRMLFQYPEWKYLEDFINEQLASRQALGSKKMSSQEQWLEHNFIAGEISGLNLIKGLPLLIKDVDEMDRLMDEVSKRDLNQTAKERGNGETRDA